jgi:hypothetical protein
VVAEQECRVTSLVIAIASVRRAMDTASELSEKLFAVAVRQEGERILSQRDEIRQGPPDAG